MPRTRFLEKSGAIRTLGVLFVAVCLFFVWITYAVFTKKFIDYAPVTLTGTTAGAQLPKNADVKLRGMIVGEMRSITPTAGGVRMEIGIKPAALNQIPRDVTAQIVPKTLFGEKYIDLIPPATPDGPKLRAGDTITRAVVPIEVETLLNNLYPLLEAVQPAELSYTLSAVSTALAGRGGQLGDALVTANAYLKKINPDVPQLVDDVNKLGTVSDGYATAMPELGRLLQNLVVTGDTVVAKRAQLEAFFQEGTRLAGTLSTFLKANGDNLITLTHETRPVVEVLGDYSTVFPCVLRSITDITPKLNSAFRDATLHIQLTVLGRQPTGFVLGASGTDPADERGSVPSKAAIDALATTQPNGEKGLAAPDCHSLHDPTNPGSLPFPHDRNGNEYNHANPSPSSPYQIYTLLGLDPDNNHNKFNNRTAAANTDALIKLVRPSIDGIDSASQRGQLKSLLAARLGLAQRDVPDVGALLLSPIVRGTEVTLHEAR